MPWFPIVFIARAGLTTKRLKNCDVARARNSTPNWLNTLRKTSNHGPQPWRPVRLSIRKQTAIQIGYQVERLASAVACHDSEGLKSLASHLGMIARTSDIESIASRRRKDSSQRESRGLSMACDPARHS